MKKQLIPISILLTLLLLVALAFLPRFIGRMQDHIIPKEPASVPLLSIDPAFLDRRDSLTFSQKLILLSKYENMSIVPAMASMTEADVLAAVNQQLQDYVDAGIFPQLSFTKTALHPLVAIDQENPSNYMLYWMAHLSCDENGVYYSMDLEIDDETGKILTLTYTRFEKDASQSLPPLDYPLLEKFSQIYLNQLDLSGFSEPVKSTSGIYGGGIYEWFCYGLNGPSGTFVNLVFQTQDNCHLSVGLSR